MHTSSPALIASAIIGIAAVLSGIMLVASPDCCGARTLAAQPVHVPPAEFSEMIAERDVRLIDVRTPAEYAAGHISGAVNIDYESPSFRDDIAKLDRDASYAIYCRSGRRSGEAAQVMAGLGFQHVTDLAGGLQAWTAAGYQITNS